MMRHLSILLAICCALCCGRLQAQESCRNTTHATLLGIGKVHQLDTYLSPLEYSGPQLQFMHETLRYTPWAQGRITMQSIWQLDAASTDNAASRGHSYGGDVRYDIGWHYNWTFGSDEHPTLRIMLGPQLDGNFGVLYNSRNGNNPAQALATLQLAASAGIIYAFRIGRKTLTARYQIDLPLLGAKFSPNYGQSYYEIFELGQHDHNVCVTHPFNAFSNRHLLSVDLPLRKITLRAGYLCDIRQSNINELKYHNYSHAFMLGFVRHLRIAHPRHSTPKGFVL